jgi:hypothetical protein
MSIAARSDNGPIFRHVNGPRTLQTLDVGAPEPPVGASVTAGAPIGLGDSVSFEHVDDGPQGWIERINGNLRGRRVSWDVVAFWLPARCAT